MLRRFRRKKGEVPPSSTEANSSGNGRKSSAGTMPFERPAHLTSTNSALASYDTSSTTRRVSDAEQHSRDQSRERHADPLGLKVLFEPASTPVMDLVFVHGLGGTSRQTWSKNRNPELFWPQEWLPLEPEICTARILTFGYNAHFSSSRDNILDISDFAKDLLFGMKFGTDERANELNVGKVPIIFVAHSMGGLVVKKAYILGQNDVNYKDIVQSTCAILFLSTPHRGTNLAEALNRILTVSVFSHSPKQYIAELKSNSPTLQEINEQFRNIAPKLQIVSFFETIQTAVGPRKMLVLEKDSSILGYPGEISTPLNADHHDVCKYTSQQDSNYISVRNVLKSLVTQFRRREKPLRDSSSAEHNQKLESLLAVSEAPDDDCDFFCEHWMPGSCEWILSKASFGLWLDQSLHSPKPQFLWLSGLPGAGKSYLSSFVVRHLKKTNRACQFYFFRYGDQTKRSPNAFLRSLAYQIACYVPEYRQRLIKLSEDGLNFEKVEARLLWQRLFVSALFKISLSKPLYWIVDALDESDSPQLILNLLSTLTSSEIPLRVMFISRKTRSLSMAFERLAETHSVGTISADDTVQDLQVYVNKEMEYIRPMHGSPGFKEHVVEKILNMADGNFLWVHLVLKEILQCHTQAAIENAMDELPADLEPLYHRMDASLAKNLRPADQALARAILIWATCARRTLTLQELAQALQPEYPPVLDLKHTINQVCGDFVVVDKKSYIVMVHQTAREFLTKTPNLHFSTSPVETHGLLFKKCLSFLLDAKPRFRIDQVTSQPFLLYASTSWSYHLALSSGFSDQDSLLMLAKFFRGPFVLTWIYVLALGGQVRTLVYAAKSLTSFLEKREKFNTDQNPLTHCLQEMETLELWATDLVKIVGKFGVHLIAYPRSIYKLIPSFCPRNSIIHRQFGPAKSSLGISVTGFSDSNWDDSLAKFSVGRDCQALSITCVGRYFAILTSDGTVILWHSLTCEEARRFPHAERVLIMRFSDAGDLLVTYGFRTTKVWNVASARQLYALENPVGARALTAVFVDNNSAILTCSDDRVIRRISLTIPPQGWETLESGLKDDTFDGKHYNSPRCVSFNVDGTQVAISYRGFPLSVWGVDPPGLIGRCEHLGDKTKGRGDLRKDVSRLGWNPLTGHVLGLYNDGCIFKWHPLDYDSQEIKTVATEIQCSSNGNIFISSSIDGTLKIWNFHHFALIYQLSCTSPVTDLAIDPDGRRVYDLRESFCNIWEPNALIRLSETDEKGSETSSTMGTSAQLSLASEASAEMLEPITALAVSLHTSSYCAGNDDGTLMISRKSEDKVVTISQGFMTIDHIVWGEDERTVATADLSGTITVYSMDLSNSAALAGRILQAKSEEGVQQILLSPTSKFLLVSSQRFANIWSLDSKSVVATTWLLNTSCQWVNHPHSKELVISFGFSDIQICRWSDLSETHRFNIDRTDIDAEVASEQPRLFRRPSGAYPMSPSELENRVDKALTTPDGSHVLLETSQASLKCRCKKQFMVIRVSDLNKTASSKDSSVITPLPLPREILARVEMPLGFITSGTPEILWLPPSQGGTRGFEASERGYVLAFMDRDFWICTWSSIETTAGSTIKRHFFPPRDWLNMECLELSSVTKDGTFLCPRNGEVAVVRNGLRDQWIA